MPIFSPEQLNFFKFTSVVLDEFPVALRQVFVYMWDNLVVPARRYPNWDDSETVRKLFLKEEGGKTKVPTTKSYSEWDCTALLEATLSAQTFATPDASGKRVPLNQLFKRPSKGAFHASAKKTSLFRSQSETYAVALDQLRLLRNNLFHQTSTQEIDKAIFDRYISLTKDAFAALGQDSTKVDEIGELGEEDFPTARLQHLEEELKREKDAAIKLKQIEDHLDKIESQVKDVSSDVRNAKTRLKHFETKVQDVVENIGSEVRNVKTGVTNVKTKVQEVGSDVKDVKTAVTDVKTKVQEVGSDVKGVKTGVTDVKTKVQDVRTDVKDVKTVVAVVKKKVQDVGPDVKKVKTGVTDVKTKVQEVGSDVKDVKTGVTDVKTKVEEVGSDMKDVKTGVTDVKTKVQDVWSDVEDVKTGVTDVKSKVEEVGSDVKDVKIGVADVKIKVEEVGSDVRDVKELMKANFEEIKQGTQMGHSRGRPSSLSILTKASCLG